MYIIHVPIRHDFVYVNVYTCIKTSYVHSLTVSTANFKGLYDEIMVVDPLLFEIRGNPDVTAMIKPSHRVHSILELLGVREMYPAEVIKHHILPCFKSNQWKVCSS